MEKQKIEELYFEAMEEHQRQAISCGELYDLITKLIADYQFECCIDTVDAVMKKLFPTDEEYRLLELFHSLNREGKTRLLEHAEIASNNPFYCDKVISIEGRLKK